MYTKKRARQHLKKRSFVISLEKLDDDDIGNLAKLFEWSTTETWAFIAELLLHLKSVTHIAKIRKKALDAAGLDQKQAAAAIGLSQPTISRWANGNNNHADSSDCNTLMANLLGMTMEELGG
jgi:predicted XRE-type DNA-binding protein